MRIEPLIGDLRAAFGLLTRFPVRLAGPATAPGLWTFPIVGAAVGAVAAGVAAPLLGFGLAPAGAALLALAASALVTGALHEDGLADTADGLGGGHTAERKLEIMRDSRIGSYGTLALILTVGLRAAGLARCADAGPWTLAISLVTGHAAARAFAAFAWASSSEARADGLSARMAPTRGSGRFIALGLALGLVVWLQGPRGAGALVAAGLTAAALTLVARAHIGGVTGDVLGAVEQVSEAAFWTVCGAAF